VCHDLIPDHFIHVFLKDGCPIALLCTEWTLHTIGEAEKWEFKFLDRHDLFRDLVAKVEKPPKKESNQLNPILCDTSRENEEFEVIQEDEDEVSLDRL